MREASGQEVHQEEVQRRHLIRFVFWFFFLFLYCALAFAATNPKVHCNIT